MKPISACWGFLFKELIFRNIFLNTIYSVNTPNPKPNTYLLINSCSSPVQGHHPFLVIYRRKSDDGEIVKGNKEPEEETVPVEQVKCLVLKDDVENETGESSKGKDEEVRKWVFSCKEAALEV